MKQFISGLLILGLVAVMAAQSPASAYQAVEGQLMTRWAKEVGPDNALPEYPRPQLVREHWMNLNGLWNYSLTDSDAKEAGPAEGEILVPFCIESALSGVKKTVGTKQKLWYTRTVELPAGWAGKQIMLHFGAVDWESTVWVNGVELGVHRGGYDPFSYNITKALKANGPQEIVVGVWDPTDSSYQPRGKQVSDPKGIWYTAVTGIWQTVWLEPLPESAIAGLRMVPDIDAGVLNLTAAGINAAPNDVIVAQARDNGQVAGEVEGAPGAPLALPLKDAKLWSPESPFLYDLRVILKRDGQTLDEVRSYFGMRKTSLQKDEAGINRLYLNNKPCFHYGPLDQGWWPDGLYTAATDAALRYDVEVTRAMGFNMARKHVKVEPARWYYHCDQLGLMVWQDMPSGDKYISPKERDIKRSKESEENYYREWGGIIDAFHNHPSIVMWVPFNEGWGQFDTNAVSDWTKKRDPSRLVNQVSGWADRAGGDVHDMHCYPGPGMFPVEETRASVLGEYGGLGWPVEGHLWWNKRNWGYRTYDNLDTLRGHYTQLVMQLRFLIPKGLAAAVYTQTSDVEGEVNGLLTYDRDLVKMEVDWLKEANDAIFRPAPKLEELLATSEKAPQTWRYTFEKPAGAWQSPAYDDSGWDEGPGVFGTEGTPGAVVRTTWDTRTIYLRRAISLDALPQGQIYLNLLHDEDAEISVNGVEVAKVKGYNSAYELIPISKEAQKAFKAGENLIAIRCKQSTGGQSIDLGIATLQEQ